MENKNCQTVNINLEDLGFTFPPTNEKEHKKSAEILQTLKNIAKEKAMAFEIKRRDASSG